MSGFNISNFIAGVSKNGIMRNNKFLVRMTYPAGFVGRSDLINSIRNLEFWCDSAVIPGVSMQTTQIRRYGYGVAEKRPVTPAFNNVSLTFISDGKGEMHKYFHNWMMSINNYNLSDGDLSNYKSSRSGGRTYELAYKDSYVSNITISVFDETQKEIVKVILRDAFPTDLGDIQLNWNDTNDFARIPVSFAYTDWYYDKI